MAKKVKLNDFGLVRSFEFGSWPLSSNFGVHVYHVDGLLIDTGFPNLRYTIRKTLQDLSVDQLLITHHHEDHSGNIDLLQKTFNCPVYASQKTAEIMTNPPRISPAQFITWGNYRPYTNFQIVDNYLSTNKYNFEIIPIPGHAEDMIALYEADQGWLFSADLYVHHKIKIFMKNESMAEQIESINRVLELDFDQLYCSHYPQIDTDVKALLRRKRDFFIDFQGQVMDGYQKGMDEKSIMKAMGLIEGPIKWMSLGNLSTANMVRAVLRDHLE